MSRVLGLALLAGALLMTVFAAAQGPGADKDKEPVLKKRQKGAEGKEPAKEDPKKDKEDKAKEDPKEKKDDPKLTDKKDDPKGLPAHGSQEKPEEIIKRIKENMEKSQARLKERDPGEKTRKMQRDIVKDLDELINQQQNNDNQGGGGGGGGGGGSASSGGGGGGRMSRRSQRMAGGKSQGQKGGQDKGGDPKNSQGQKSAKASEGGGGGAQDAKKNTSRDLEKDLWGHLPAHKRLEMDAYSKERFMPRYEDILRQYYRTIAEQSRRKD